MVLYDGGDNIHEMRYPEEIMIDQKEIYLNNPMITRHYSLEDNVNYCFVVSGEREILYDVSTDKRLEANGIPLSQMFT